MSIFDSYEDFLDENFKIRKRGSTVTREIYCGFLNFLALVTVLAVNTSQLSSAGYDRESCASATSISTGISCILLGLTSNLPFLCAPSLSTAIYLSVFMQTNQFTVPEGNACAFILGVLLVASGAKLVTNFFYMITPRSIKVGICVGLSLLISLQALTHIGLVVPGSFTIVTLGNVWSQEALISMFTFAVIGILLHYDFKAAYVVGLFVGSVLYWHAFDSWPSEIVSFGGKLSINILRNDFWMHEIWKCSADLFVISMVKMIGLSIALSDLAGLSREDARDTPGLSWIYVSCGLGTLVSAMLGSGPILVVVESAAGIMAGARTGFSSVVCGLLFFLSYFFYPFFSAIPNAGTAPVLLMVALLLFENSAKVQWSITKEALPAFMTAIFTAFTFSVIHGVAFGIAIYITMVIGTGDILSSLKEWYDWGFAGTASSHHSSENRLYDSYQEDRYQYTRNTLSQQEESGRNRGYSNIGLM